MRPTRFLTLILFALICAVAAGFPVRAAADSAPIRLAGSTLLAIAGDNGLTSSERAAVINARLEKWLADPQASVQVESQRNGPALMLGDDMLLLITREDARLNGASAEELARATSKRLSEEARGRLEAQGSRTHAWELAQGAFTPFLMILGLLAGGATAAWLISWGTMRVADNPRRYGLPVTGASVTLTGGLLSLAVVTLATMLALTYLPLQSWTLSAAVALLGAMGLIASADALANFAGGTLLALNPLFKEGDRIRMGGRAGRVTKIGKLFTRLATERHGERLVPNGALLRRGVALLPPTETACLKVPVRLAYTVPRDLAQAIVLEAACRTPGVSDEPFPECLVSELEEENLRYELHAELEAGSRLAVVASHFHINLLEVLAENGLLPGGTPLGRTTLRIGMAPLESDR